MATSTIKTTKNTRTFALSLVTLLFFAAALGYSIYWFLAGRTYQETDNAYVMGNQIQVTPLVQGTITAIYADNLSYVEQGSLLVKFSPEDAEQTFEKTKMTLANSVRNIQQIIINNKQLIANIELRKTELEKANSNLVRREVLNRASAIGLEELQHARDAATMANSALSIATEQYNANYAMVLNTPLEKQPSVLQAAINVREAWLALQRTRILAPVSGYIARRTAQLGGFTVPGTVLMVIIPSDEVWVEANFKESQLVGIYPGQKAIVTSDFYGSQIVYKGEVVGIDMGTGSAFSLLPAQNATGNWIKVVQRLPVRIKLDKEQVEKYPLRIGLSMRVRIDLQQNNVDVPIKSVGASLLKKEAIYKTQSLDYDMTPIDKIIDSIILDNLG